MIDYERMVGKWEVTPFFHPLSGLAVTLSERPVSPMLAKKLRAKVMNGC